MSEYKIVLKQWYKGTGGGSGDYNMFQDWSQEKVDKYNTDPTIYNHTVIANYPPVLINDMSQT